MPLCRFKVDHEVRDKSGRRVLLSVQPLSTGAPETLIGCHVNVAHQIHASMGRSKQPHHSPEDTRPCSNHTRGMHRMRRQFPGGESVIILRCPAEVPPRIATMCIIQMIFLELRAISSKGPALWGTLSYSYFGRSGPPRCPGCAMAGESTAP